MYTEFLLKEHILISRNLSKAVNEIANRWVQAMLKPHNYGYTGWGHLDETGEWIWFDYKHYDGICYWDPEEKAKHKFSSKYLIDDTNLEQDAAEWHKNNEEKKKKKREYEESLSKDPKVQEFLNLKKLNSNGDKIFSLRYN